MNNSCYLSKITGMTEYYSLVIFTKFFLMWMLECEYRNQTMENFLQNFANFKIISYRYIYTKFSFWNFNGKFLYIFIGIRNVEIY